MERGEKMSTDFIFDHHLDFLDNINQETVEDGITTRELLLDAYPTMTNKEASTLLRYWMRRQISK